MDFSVTNRAKRYDCHINWIEKIPPLNPHVPQSAKGDDQKNQSQNEEHFFAEFFQ